MGRLERRHPNNPASLAYWREDQTRWHSGAWDSARLLSDSLAKVTSQAVIVDNRGGGSGNVAYQYVARANPDGYTLLSSYSAYHVGNPNLTPKLPWAQKDFVPVALITVATNVISHGVDVERFNLMVMDSIPEETADYIQASSRSGRRHVGLILAVLPSYSLRASSIYHRFKEYHQHLERLVSPVSVNRFAKYAAKKSSSA